MDGYPGGVKYENLTVLKISIIFSQVILPGLAQLPHHAVPLHPVQICFLCFPPLVLKQTADHVISKCKHLKSV